MMTDPSFGYSETTLRRDRLYRATSASVGGDGYRA